METEKIKVLVCDDSSLIRKKLKDLLMSMDCEVFEGVNGNEGVDMYKQIQPDVVFMDIVMPESDGLEALAQIKSYEPNAKVIMLSSIGTSSKLVQALKHGAMDFIQKPYTVEQISKVITDIKQSMLALSV